MSCKEGFRTALVGSYGRLCKRVGGVLHGVHASPPAVEGRSRQLVFFPHLSKSSLAAVGGVRCRGGRAVPWRGWCPMVGVLRFRACGVRALDLGARLDAVAGASPYGSAPWIACGGRYALRI